MNTFFKLLFLADIRLLNGRYRWTASCLLLMLLLSFSIYSPTFAQQSFSLGDNLVGSFGNVTKSVRSEVESLTEDSGIDAAALEAQSVIAGLGNNAVPMIDDLSDPYQANAEEAITEAVKKVQLATKILSKISDAGAKQAVEFIQNSPMFEGADFGITLPAGRIRIHRQGTEVSICRTVVGPLGSVIITGVSNAEQLCRFNDPRMSNPTKSLLAFSYMAAGNTFFRTNRILLPNPASDLTKLPAPIEAETYVKVNNQWVQIRLAGADPKSLEVEAKVEVGIKGGVSYYVEAEVEGEAALKISVKPLYAVEVIRSTTEAMATTAASLGLDMKAANVPPDVAVILKAGLQHLADIEGNYEDGFGEISIEVKVTGGIGVGIWDTGISVISASRSFSLIYPLDALVSLQASAIENYLDIALGITDSSLKLGTAILEGNTGPGLVTFTNEAKQASSVFINGALQDLLAASTHIKLKSAFKLTAAGDADKESIDLFETGLTIPVGMISANLLANPGVLGDAFTATAHILLASIDPNETISDQTWTDLEQVLVPGIKYRLKALNPLTFNTVALEDTSLLETIKIVPVLKEVLIGVIESGRQSSFEPLNYAVEQAFIANNQQVISFISEATFSTSKQLGANGALGAEIVAEVGAKITLKGELNGRLFLLMYDPPLYTANHEDLLSKASVPIEFSLDIGASVGEGVELTVDGGGKISFNVFELSAKHWNKKLPTPALMEVAGFSVLEFDGTVNLDESFAGNGFLMLPWGGIVSSDFSVDSFGNVSSGSWSGGIDLGPLGKFTWLSGELDNLGLHGQVDIGFLGASFTADFIANSSGLLFGTYNGELNIAGYQLAAAELELGTDGQIYGQFQGDIDITGFTATTDMVIDNDGLMGSGSLNVLGSDLVSSDLAISRSGIVTGTFAGSIQAGPHTLSSVSLQAVNGGLTGTALLDLPGIADAQVDLHVVNGEVTAYYQGDLLNGLVPYASFAISQSGITLKANLNTSQLAGISSQVFSLVSDAAAAAQNELAAAQTALADAQAFVDTIEANIEATSAQILKDLANAQQAVIDAEEDVQRALYNLNTVIAQIDELNSSYAGLINNAQQTIDDAQASVNSASSVVTYYNNEIRKLDNWYNGLSKFDKAWYSAYYTAERAKLVTLRTSAQAALTTANAALSAAEAALSLLQSELAQKLNPLLISKNTLQGIYDTANSTLDAAIAMLNSISIDGSLASLFSDLDIANGTLDAAQEFVNKLQGILAVVDYAATHGAEGAFTVLGANIDQDLDLVDLSSSFEIVARVVYLGQKGLMTLTFTADDPVDSFHQAIIKLQSGIALLDSSDVTKPTVSVQQPAEWMSNKSLVQLIASDNFGGSGIASITYSATGAQSIPTTTVAGEKAFALIEIEGVTRLTYYATDVMGNVSANTMVTTNIDNSKPQISVTHTGVVDDSYEVIIEASDLIGSGIAYLTVSARGVESFTENIETKSSVVVRLTEEGLTTLTITAVDIAGNSTVLLHDVDVPNLSVVEEEPVVTTEPVDVTKEPPVDDTRQASEGSSSGSTGLPFLLLIALIGCLRKTQNKLLQDAQVRPRASKKQLFLHNQN